MTNNVTRFDHSGRSGSQRSPEQVDRCIDPTVRKPHWSLWLALILLLFVAGPGRAASPADPRSEGPDWAALSVGFEELFVPTAPTSTKEDVALQRAILSYRKHAKVEDFRSLENFLAAYPHSGWRVAVLTNLGLAYYRYVYFSKTIDALGRAWREGRDATEPKAKALVDRAVGELLRMHARLGHSEQLTELLHDIGQRGLSGPAAGLRTGAKEGLWEMRNNPGVAYLCGPMALKNLLLARGTPREELAFLDAYRSGPQGVTLTEVAHLADQAKVRYRLVHRNPGDPVPVPSIVHWKLSHFAAITEERDGRFRIVDPTFGEGVMSVSRAAIGAEASGYFLVLGEKHVSPWRDIDSGEADRIRGMGYTTSSCPGCTRPDDPKTKPDHCESGMCDYNFTEMVVSLNLNDRPVGYAPPIGPPVFTRVTYNHQEMDRPANPNFFNLGQKWTLNWLSWIQDDPNDPNSNLRRYVGGGGYVVYNLISQANNAWVPQVPEAASLVRTTSPSITYTRQLPDGGAEIYAQSDNATTYPRRIFLTKIIDPAQNTLTLSYDNQHRLTSITDAANRQTTFSYGQSGQTSLLVQKITDPFGRYAQLNYDSMGRLQSITDVLGVTSTLGYNDPTDPSFVNSMTTPYGTTNFTYTETPDASCTTAAGAHLKAPNCNKTRALSATSPPTLSYPSGVTEHLMFADNLGFPMQPNTEPVPNYSPPGGGHFFTDASDTRNTYYWDQHAFQDAFQDQDPICAPMGLGCARIRHWNHLGGQMANHVDVTGATLDSIKYPFENRIWFLYPGQSGGEFSGTLDKPSAIARVLDDGSTQVTQIQYNCPAIGGTYFNCPLGNILSITDPVGRQTTFQYYPTNQIDLMAIYQGSDLIASFGPYNSQHRPSSYTDAAGQTTKYSYNPAGQLTQIIDPLGEMTTFNYDPLGYLMSIVNANRKVQASFTYDCCGRIMTRTDSEGYTVTYTYDNMDRLLQETYPDGTMRTYTWDEPGRPLDLHTITDRLGRSTTYQHDALRNLVEVTDPLGNETQFGYWENGKLKSMTDPNNNMTRWDIDGEGRVIAKHYADNSTIKYVPENSTSRLHSVTDARMVTKTYTYYADDRISAIAYSDSTPSVGFVYDMFSPRLMTASNPNYSTSFSYVPVGTLGALQVQQETEGDNHAVVYQYDELGRVKTRTVDGDTESFAYDAIRRLMTHQDDLGQFAISYLGQTPQVTGLHSVVPTGMVGTDWTYDTNTNDRRLKSIVNSGGARGYTYTSLPEKGIIGSAETIRGVAHRSFSYGYDDDNRLLTATFSPLLDSRFVYSYDAADNLTLTGVVAALGGGRLTSLTPNSLNEISIVRGPGSFFTFQYDANGNLLQDDQHTYTWDAENRLTSIGYQGGASTAFEYDALGRRISITDGAPSGTRVRSVWCGEVLCEAAQQKTGSSAFTVTRRYLMEGEALPAQVKAFYYARDQLGSVRDVVDVKTDQDLQSYDYDPYGRDITAGLEFPAYSTDFRYAGMFYHQPSGLYLTRYRAYDPRYGRWLSRDPLGEFAEIGGLSNSNQVTPVTSFFRTFRDAGTRLTSANLVLGSSDPMGELTKVQEGSDFTTAYGVLLLRSTEDITFRPWEEPEADLSSPNVNLYSYGRENPLKYTDPFGLQTANDGCASDWAQFEKEGLARCTDTAKKYCDLERGGIAASLALVSAGGGFGPLGSFAVAIGVLYLTKDCSAVLNQRCRALYP